MRIPGMITRAEAAKRLQCRRGTIDRLIYAKQIDVVFPYPGNTKHMLVSEASLGKYISKIQKLARPYDVAARLPVREVSRKQQQEALPNLAEVAQRQAAQQAAFVGEAL